MYDAWVTMVPMVFMIPETSVMSSLVSKAAMMPKVLWSLKRL